MTWFWWWDEDWWEFTVLVTLSWNSLSSCTNLWLRCSFYSFVFPNGDFEPPWWWLKEEFRKFLPFFFFFSPRKFQRFHHQRAKYTERIFKKLSKKFPTMAVGQRKKNWFLVHLKHLFHHSENTSMVNGLWLIPFIKIRSSKSTVHGRGGGSY